MAALTTAFELTRDPATRARYEVTIYQQGHRLGGKCASARTRSESPQGTVERIEEHGLHMFFGFYENAFGMMRECYEELAQQPLAHGETRRLSWHQAFLPHELIMFGEEWRGRVRSWAIPFPRRRGEPGSKGRDASGVISLVDGSNVLSGLLELLASTLLRAADFSADGLGAHVSGERELQQTLDDIRETSAEEDLIAALARAVRLVAQRLPRDFDAIAVVRVLRAVELVILRIGSARIARHAAVRNGLATGLSLLRSLLLNGASSARGLDDFARHQLRSSVDFFFTMGVGLLRDDMLRADVDWFAFDTLDYRDWLRKHGGSEEMIESGPLRALGDAVFAHAQDVGWAAGTTLHLMLRMLLTYKQSILFRFGGGTGDVLIAPLYRVLEARGVRFKFFHRIEQLIPDCSGAQAVVGQIKFRRQATVRAGAAAYRPLELFSGQLCWPVSPDFDQLEEGDALRSGHHDLEDSWNRWDSTRPVETLELGRDFDAVVLGIGVGALPHLCEKLARAADDLPHVARGKSAFAPRLSEMLKQLRTVETLGLQLWLKRPLAELGGPAHRGVGIAYAQPLDTWSEMNHLLPYEKWPSSAQPAALLYLCSNLEEPDGYVPPPFHDHDHPQRQRAHVAQVVKRWLDEHGARIFTRLQGTDGFDYEQLIDPEERSGAARLQAQWYCATANPSDRYVLSPPNTSCYRLRPHESGFANLVLAGDWTLNAISAGCVEGTVISGRDAARALIGEPVHILGDWLTQVRPELRSTPLLPAPVPVAASSDPAAFVRLPFDLLSLPPYACKRAKADWFFFAADVSALQLLCDTYLNHQGSPTRYEPLSAMVAFVATQVESIYSEQEPVGFLPEKDFGFWIPVRSRAVTDSSEVHVASPIAWFQPCLWVDSGPAAAGGREVHGMSKMLARLGAPPESPSYYVDTLALTDRTYTQPGTEPRVECVEQRIVELTLAERTGLSAHITSLGKVGKLVADSVSAVAKGATESLSLMLDQLRAGTVPLVALKQLPDIAAPQRACYKAVVETPTRATAYRSFRIDQGQHRLKLFGQATHRLAEQLGLHGTSLGRTFSAHAFLTMQVDFDFRVEPGRVIFDVLAAHQPTEKAATPKATHTRRRTEAEEVSQ